MTFRQVSTMPKLTLEDAKRLVKEVIDERGADFVYQPPKRLDGTNEDAPYDNYGESCANWVINAAGEREASCLVGKVFDKIGVLDQLPKDQQIETAGVTCDDYFTEDAVEFLTSVQSVQDLSACYGEIEKNFLTDEK
mgnify:FL=1